MIYHSLSLLRINIIITIINSQKPPQSATTYTQIQTTNSHKTHTVQVSAETIWYANLRMC